MIRRGEWSRLSHEVLSRSARQPDTRGVEQIVRDVEERGWEALREWSLRLDGLEPRVYRRPEMETAWRRLERPLREALSLAARRIRDLHRAQLPRPRGLGGAVAAQTIPVPVGRVGVYAPGGRHPYPSTLLMCAIPAKVAGVEYVAAASPLRSREAETLMLAAAHLSGVDALLSAGGPQAVAALAFGVGVEPVDKVAGPGGVYVQAAKRLLYGRVGLDMVAGPTELVAVSDGTAEPELLALDLAAQAEHGPGGLSLLLDTDQGHLDAVYRELEELVGEDYADIYLARVDTLEEALEAANRLAPEHLLLAVEEPRRLLPAVRNAGAVSLGTPPALLDYTAGTNHVLPTMGWARWRGGLSVYDFLKPVYVVEGADPLLAEAAARLAEAEGLRLHAESLRRRLRRDSDTPIDNI